MVLVVVACFRINYAPAPARRIELEPYLQSSEVGKGIVVQNVAWLGKTGEEE